MNTVVRLPVSILIAGLLMSSCFRAAKSPTEVVTAFYAAANQGRYADGEKLLSAKTRHEIEAGLGSREQGLKMILDGESRNGTIDRVIVVTERINGDNATVVVKLIFRDGETRDGKQQLVKESGEWKVNFL